ncbi:MAG: hypothetical protein ACM3QZ_05325 [Solirubrobacterales bacterium]
MKRYFQNQHGNAVALFLLLLFGAYLAARQHPVPPAGPLGPVTLLQAIAISKKSAESWDHDARLVYAVSTEPANTSPAQGGGWNGQRAWWNIVWFDAERGTNLIVAVRDGKAVSATEASTAYTTPINTESIRWDSPAAVMRLRRNNMIQRQTAVHFELIGQNQTLLRLHYRDRMGGSHMRCIDPGTGKVVVTSVRTGTR